MSLSGIRGLLREVGVFGVAAGFAMVASFGAVPAQRIAGIEVQGSPAIRATAARLGLEAGLGRPVSDRIVMSAVERLKRIGRAAGVKVDFRSSPAGVWVCYRVRENPKIESVEFRGNTAMTGAELAGDLALKHGQVLDYDVLYREVNRIPKIYLARKGVLYAGVLSPASVEVTGGRIVIDIQEFKLRSLEVRGASSDLRSAVLASLPLRRGQVLRRSDLLGGLFNVWQLPQVKDVDYRPRFDRERGEITLVLNLVEQGREALPRPAVAN
ncbi:MAG: hypothetical protein HY814_07835 [Candidatus Riflebacteria bacterium]|nr:hypothetical protein [Candidatus Riflebacteria bacterium]